LNTTWKLIQKKHLLPASLVNTGNQTYANKIKNNVDKTTQ